ncbi:MAG: DUF885 domain-containing protein [Arcanobacterium sp.]|nr:DUF885 domain-containing protein [Arcanobacterium sp.]
MNENLNTERNISPIDELANGYLETQLQTTPELVTYLGMPGASEEEFSNYSPEGAAEIASLQRETLAKLESLTPVDDVDKVTVAALQQSLGLELEKYERGEIGDIANIATPLQGISEIFDLMGQETKDEWNLIIARMNNVEKAVKSWEETLYERAHNGPKLAAKQVELAIAEAEKISSEQSTFARLAADCAQAYPELAEQISQAATSARATYDALSKFLATEIAPLTGESEAFGRERYALRSYEFIGAKIDLDESYAWAESELARIDAEQLAISHELYGSGVSVKEAMNRLNNEPSRMLHGSDALKAWMQETSDAAVEALAGTHFEIPDELRKLECMIAPSGSGAIYYTGPTDDFSRGGRMWWAVPHGTESFTTWQEKTTVYHEGVPGHHLQIGYTTYLKNVLNLWRRHGSWFSGHGEGWALYAEGLMAELGFMDDLGDRMGVLDSERLRTARVMLDIGVHCELPAPAQYREISPVWNREVAWQFLLDNVAMDESFLNFELNRYLGWAGQAPSYKIGHRIWTELRTDAENRAREAGQDFDLKAWHTKALSIGSVGLDVLRNALA